jgi:hypothetical protein
MFPKSILNQGYAWSRAADSIRSGRSILAASRTPRESYHAPARAALKEREAMFL